MPENPPPEKPRSVLPWLILALWLAWLAAMAYMSRAEWGRERPERRPPAPTRENEP